MFVKAEPGAGLIRDGVEDRLLAPYDLVATAGRGGIPFAVRDAAGNLLPAEPDEEETKKKSRGRSTAAPAWLRLRRRLAWGYGGPAAARRRTPARSSSPSGRRAARQEEEPPPSPAARSVELPPEEEEDRPSPLADYKTEVRGQRWVAIVGLLNNKQFRERYAKALKISYESPESHPDYRRVELERQQLRPARGREWSDWQIVDRGAIEELTRDIAFEEDATSRMTPPRTSGSTRSSTSCPTSRPATGPASITPSSSRPRSSASCSPRRTRRRRPPPAAARHDGLRAAWAPAACSWRHGQHGLASMSSA